MLGLYCYLMSSITGFTSDLTRNAFVISSNALIQNVQSLLILPGVGFNGNDIANYGGMALVSCPYLVSTFGAKNYCQQTGTPGIGNCVFKSGASPTYSTRPSSLWLTFSVFVSSRLYYQQAAMTYTGSVFWSHVGNTTYCNAVCDMLFSCAGYTIDASSNCKFMTQMDTTNYLSSATSTAYFISLQIMTSVNMAIVNSLEVITPLTLMSPILPGNIVNSYHCDLRNAIICWLLFDISVQIPDVYSRYNLWLFGNYAFLNR